MPTKILEKKCYPLKWWVRFSQRTQKKSYEKAHHEPCDRRDFAEEIS
tara:strand:+ start:643 stop:783 length:141 start_codon:yes stop_codon:yes gene_type:complete